MKAAIYYPHLKIESEDLFKHALLFWDQLEIITPRCTLQMPHDAGLARATKLLAIPHEPSDEEKAAAHEQLMNLVSKPLPKWFFVNAPAPRDFIYTEKFMWETWRELKNAGLATAVSQKEKAYWANQSFALVMMGILAECCAGKTKVTLTDKSDAYQAVENAFAVEVNAEQRLPGPGDEVLLRAQVLAPSLQEITLEKLMKLREKELKKGGHKLRQLRHKLFDAVTKFSQDQAEGNFAANDRAEVERLFLQTLNDDFGELGSELGVAKKNWVLSPELAALVVAGGAALGFLAMPLGLPFTIAGAAFVGARLRNKYEVERHKALAGHFSSYLYLARH